MKAMVELAFTVWKLCDMVNKHVGSKLDINEITWKVHRGNVIQKMSADSVVDLVEIGARLGLTPTRNLWQNR